MGEKEEKKKPDNNHLSFGKKEAEGHDLNSPVTPYWEEIPDDQVKKKTGRLWIVALILLIIAAAGGLFYYNARQKQKKKELDQIREDYEQIMDICSRQKEDYLSDLIDLDFVEEEERTAKEVHDSEDLPSSQKMKRLGEILTGLEEKDEKFILDQTDYLNGSYEDLSAGLDDLKPYFIQGEEDRISQYQTDYSDHLDRKKFKDASEDLDQWKALADQITDSSEDSSRYQAKDFLEEGEVLPATLRFLVDADSYTENLTDDHISLKEKVGKEDPAYLAVHIKSAEKKGSMVDYTVSFDSANTEDYDSKREYSLHVRNLEGTKGFDAKDDVSPQDQVEKIVKDRLGEFVDAFNKDCAGKSYDRLSSLVQAGSNAESALKKIIGSKEEEVLSWDSGDLDYLKIRSDQTVSARIACTYRIVQYNSWTKLKDRPKEEKKMRESLEIRQVNGEDWVVYKEGLLSPKMAQKLSESSFLVKETMKENDSFTFSIEDQKIGDITEYSFDTPEITKVESVKVKPDPEKSVRLSELEKTSSQDTAEEETDQELDEEDDTEEESAEESDDSPPFIYE